MTVWGILRLGVIRTVAGITWTWIALVASSAAQGGPPGHSLYRFDPVPHWVKRLTPEYEAPLPASGVSDGAWDLLLDRQIEVTPEGDDYYQHSATRLISASGVEDGSQINITLDPTFQTLSLSSVAVVRQGRTLDQKASARITALPQETELSNRIYNGSYNINILLTDVRVGDVVEYEYTIHSRERMFPGHFAERMPVGWSVPMRQQRLRILWPASQELSYRIEDPSVPTASVHAGLRELEWQWHDLLGIRGDDERPRWYSPWPHFEASNSKDWSEVARGIVPLFRVRDPHTAGVMAVVKEIRDAGGTPAQQALHALQFVQEQIRYVSISIGQGAFRPASPETVLARRFGDCKDKSLLLATILRNLGIEAQPALVNTRRGRVLDSILPTPYAFDHAIVRMRLDNEVYWLDGTTEKQFSALSSGAPADFERALVIDAATQGLAVIPRPAPGLSSKRSEVVVDLRAGIDKPAKLDITTFYQGRLADVERRDFADQTAAERESSYVNYIARYYTGAKPAAPITIDDDQTNDVVAVHEHYSINQPFTRNQNGRAELYLPADELYRYVNRLKASVRKAPLAIEYPVRIEQTVRVLLTGSWDFDNETVKIDNPAFRYESSVRYDDSGRAHQLTLDYRYDSRTDVVEPAAFARYQADRQRAYDDLGYYIRPGKRVPPVSKLPTTIAIAPQWAALLGLLVSSWLALRFVYRWDPRPARAQRHWPVGIRGWLLLAAISVVVSPLSWAGSLLLQARLLLDAGHWSRLGDTVPEPLKSWAPAVLLALAFAGALLWVGQVLLAYLFFKRRSSVPYLFIGLIWGMTFYNIVALLFPIAANLRDPLDDITLARDLLGDIATAAVDTLYFLLSKRVRATFVVRLAPTRALVWRFRPSGGIF